MLSSILLLVLLMAVAVSGGICTEQWQPICSSTATTYANICALQDSGDAFAHTGPCMRHSSWMRPGTKCGCPIDYKYVCAKNGRTYGNMCFLKCWKQELAYIGDCSPPE